MRSEPQRLTFIFVGVQQVLELRVEDLQVLLDEHLLALPGELVLRALVKVHLDPPLFLQETGLRLRKRTLVNRLHLRLFRTTTVTNSTRNPALPNMRKKTREGSFDLGWGGEGMLTTIYWSLVCAFLCNYMSVSKSSSNDFNEVIMINHPNVFTSIFFPQTCAVSHF